MFSFFIVGLGIVNVSWSIVNGTSEKRMFTKRKEGRKKIKKKGSFV